MKKDKKLLEMYHKMAFITVIVTIILLCVSLLSVGFASGLAMLFLISVSLYYLMDMDLDSNIRQIITLTFFVILIFASFFILYEKQVEKELESIIEYQQMK